MKATYREAQKPASVSRKALALPFSWRYNSPDTGQGGGEQHGQGQGFVLVARLARVHLDSDIVRAGLSGVLRAVRRVRMRRRLRKAASASTGTACRGSPLPAARPSPNRRAPDRHGRARSLDRSAPQELGSAEPPTLRLSSARAKPRAQEQGQAQTGRRRRTSVPAGPGDGRPVTGKVPKGGIGASVRDQNVKLAVTVGTGA